MCNHSQSVFDCSKIVQNRHVLGAPLPESGEQARNTKENTSCWAAGRLSFLHPFVATQALCSNLNERPWNNDKIRCKN